MICVVTSDVEYMPVAPRSRSVAASDGVNVRARARAQRGHEAKAFQGPRGLLQGHRSLPEAGERSSLVIVSSFFFFCVRACFLACLLPCLRACLRACVRA
jgi:hypothetical protein